eukprot:TRINITY_DN60891_c0_g1_i1.p1 TRINITY_DN60891_c0_g1~~TRINITY_DN60891_c0_g1_i1.p1  ORF type:complete len:1009 (+),score=145.30 TRINITY_DN60891_c0_g1_i1:195-3029(+)
MYGKGEMWRSRLDNKEVCWCAAQNDQAQWIQWDFGKPKVIVRLQTKGRHGFPQWVKQYYLAHSDDGVNWQYTVPKGWGSAVDGGSGKTYYFDRTSGASQWVQPHQEYIANSDSDSAVEQNLLPGPVVGRYLRLIPTQWNNHISMRAEIFGADPPSNPLVGPGTQAVIPDSSISVSSCYNNCPGHGQGTLWRSRLNNMQTPWCAGKCDHLQWIQWDFGAPKLVTKIQTKGRNSDVCLQWVKKYKITYYGYGPEWVTPEHEYIANDDGDTLVEQVMEPPFVARWLRLHPTEWHGHIALRAEVLGGPGPGEEFSKSYIVELFRKFDKNGNGTIEPDELQHVLKSVNPAFTDEAIMAQFDAIDKDKDGVVGFEELVNWIFPAANDDESSVSREHRAIAQCRQAVIAGDFDALQRGLRQWCQTLDEAPIASVEKTSNDLTELAQAAHPLLEDAGCKQVEVPKTDVRRCPNLDPQAEHCLFELFQLADLDRDGYLDWNECCSLGLATGHSEQETKWMWQGLIQNLPSDQKDCFDVYHYLSSYNQLWTSFSRDKAVHQATEWLKLYKEARAAKMADIAQLMTNILWAIRRYRLQPGVLHHQTRRDLLANKKSINTVCQELLTFSWAAGAKRTKYAMIQAKQLGMDWDVYRNMVNSTKSASDSSHEGLQLPHYWDVSKMQEISSSGLGLSLEAGDGKNLVARVPLNSDELRSFQALFNATFRKVYTRDRKHSRGGVPDGMEVVKGERIQNLHNWIEFSSRQKEIVTEIKARKTLGREVTNVVDKLKTSGQLLELGIDLDADANAGWFFHGTNDWAAHAITDGDFLINLAGSNAGTLYGRGIYLAECCSKSDEYCTEEFGLRCILVCRATLGNMLYTDEVKPDVEGLVRSCVNGPFHSVLGDREKCRGTFREFMVYDDNQVYPEFLLYYRRTYSSSPNKGEEGEERVYTGEEG